MLVDTAELLRKIPRQPKPATDKLRQAWDLLADAFRHSHLQGAEFARLRSSVIPTRHTRFSEPIEFLKFAKSVSKDEAACAGAIDSRGFRDDICDRAILVVADWIEGNAIRMEESRTAGYLGLIVNEEAVEVRRCGHNEVVRFEPGSAAWHMVVAAWKAEQHGVQQAQISFGYPGDPTPRARKIVKQHANALLAVLGVRLAPNRPPLLEEIPPRSPSRA